jgi:hypothetical protein
MESATLVLNRYTISQKFHQHVKGTLCASGMAGIEPIMLPILVRAAPLSGDMHAAFTARPNGEQHQPSKDLVAVETQIADVMYWKHVI